MRESTERTIRIPNMSKRTFLFLLEYIYTDTVMVDVDNAIQLYIAADLYHMERLCEMCVTAVKRNLCADNAGRLLQEAAESCCEILKKLCMDFVVENFDAVSKTEGIKELDHTLLLEILSLR